MFVMAVTKSILESNCLESLKCLNGGNCTTFGYCLCPPGYYGVSCRLKDCNSQECQNGGYCLYATDSQCTCPTGYSGDDCEIDIYAPNQEAPLDGPAIITLVMAVCALGCLLCVAYYCYNRRKARLIRLRYRPNQPQARRNLDQSTVVDGLQLENDLPPDYGSCVDLDEAGLPLEGLPPSIGDPPPESPPPTYESYASSLNSIHATTSVPSTGGDDGTGDPTPPPPSYDEAVVIQEDTTAAAGGGGALHQT